MTYCTIIPLRIGEITIPGFMAGLVKQPRTELGVWAFLVEAGEKKILFDGGLVADIEITHRFVDEALGPGFGYAAGDEASVRRAIGAHGLEADDIDVAVVSHLHHDHAGALDWLPRAQVWVHAHELEVLDSPYVMNVIPTWQITPGTRATLAKLESQSRLVTWDGERENLADGVELLRVGGHTKGSVALVGDVCADRRVALLGDLLLTEVHLQQGAVPTTALDAYETIRSVSRLLASADELWPGHAAAGPVEAAAAAGSWPRPIEWRDNG